MKRTNENKDSVILYQHHESAAEKIQVSEDVKRLFTKNELVSNDGVL